MKHLLLTILTVVCLQLVQAQENGIVKFNTTENTATDMMSRILKYPQFTRGRAFLLSGAQAEALFNYNYDTNELLFIDAKKDTLALAAPELYRYVVVATDTFVYSKHGFLQQICATPFCTLLVKRNLVMVGSEKKSAYGGYSSTSSSAPLRSFSDGTVQRTLSTDENFYYRYKDTYFFADRFRNVYPANQKGTREIGWKKEKTVREFLDRNDIDFSQKEDLLKLMAFFQTIDQN